ncbi:hypothetical protein [Streptomyces lavendofoliae]|uniref:hypothetical protein n=1 Tax=Streptomyces lavendofoliae TaxID=67314 RepID=UPI001675CDA1|nr:hypothetical protein [Streptomyces lavendofoliae]
MRTTVDNRRESAWDGHQNEPHDSTVQLDGFTDFDAFGRRGGGAGHHAGAPGHPGPSGYRGDHGYPAADSAHATGQEYPAGDFAHATGQGYPTGDFAPLTDDGYGHSLAAAGHGDETLAYRADALGPAGPDDRLAAGDADLLTAELPAVTMAIPSGAPAPVPSAAPAPPSAARSGPADHEPSDGPVFVDESGRRSKKFRRLGWVLATACAVYAITLVVSVIGGNSSAPWLLIPGPADEKKTETTQVEPAPSGSVTPSDGNSGAVPGAPAPTDSTGAVIPRPVDGGTQGVPTVPGPGASSAPDATPSAGTAAGTGVEEKPADRPIPDRPTDGGTTPQPPPVTPPETPDPDPTDTPPTPPTEEPTDPPVGDSGGQEMAAEGAQ